MLDHFKKGFAVEWVHPPQALLPVVVPRDRLDRALDHIEALAIALRVANDRTDAAERVMRDAFALLDQERPLS